ncbi:MAG: O-antigen ligase family protein, partial [Deltaproteobacteria bacterium]
MNKQLSFYLDQAIFAVLMIVAGVTPLLFTNLTTDFYETPKLMFLVGSVILLYGMWIFSWVSRGKITVQKTPLDVWWMIFLVLVVLSTYLSVSRYPAIFGDMTRMHGTAISWVTYILLFFVAVSNLASKDRIKSLLYVLLGSGLVVALVSIFSYFRLFLPFDFARSVNFTPTGSTFSAAAMLLALIPIPLVSILKPNKFLPLPIALTLASIFGMTVALIGSTNIYLVMALVFGLSLLSGDTMQVFKRVPLFLVPVGMTALIMVMGYLPLPGNIFQQTSAGFPREIQLPLGVSWKITASSFRDAPFFGTGPATYGFNFTAYKPAEFNNLNYWNVNFDTAYNELLQILGTLGFFGFAGLTILLVLIGKLAKSHLKTEGETGWLAISVLVAILLMFFHATTLVSMVITILLIAAFLMSVPAIRERSSVLSLGLKASAADDKQFDLFPILVFVVYLIAAVPLAFKYYNVVMADFNHRKALAVAGTSGTQTYTYLQRSEALNPYVDLYRVDLAQTNFALANAIAGQATSSAGLNDEQKQTIQTLLSQAI